jgi:hypothetical protein
VFEALAKQLGFKLRPDGLPENVAVLYRYDMVLGLSGLREPHDVGDYRRAHGWIPEGDLVDAMGRFEARREAAREERVMWGHDEAQGVLL